jgi:photosystem II stability/assembly factor-like uncharacterized protein
MTTLLMIGTRKGLFLARSDDDRKTWSVSPPQLPMQEVSAIGIDTRDGGCRVLAGSMSWHWGPTVVHSDDLGETWSEPEEGAIKFPESTDAALARVWQLRPAPASQPGVVWAGTEPAALFRSDDGGEHFTLVEGLWDHPHRPSWQPGGGGQCLHTVVPHADDADRVLVAISAAGVYRTTDGGKSWEASNAGICARFLPEGEQYPEFGHCVHKVSAHPGRPEQLFLQNHGGVYRSDDGGDRWVSIAEGLPSDFGFGMVADPNVPGSAFVFPIVSGEERFPPDRKCRVYRTDDAGASWRALDTGLPAGPHYGAVLRDGLCADDADPVGVYFGNRNGEVFASADRGEHWQQVAAHLPSVLCVRAAVLP